jgi:hypothetical protein
MHINEKLNTMQNTNLAPRNRIWLYLEKVPPTDAAPRPPKVFKAY